MVVGDDQGYYRQDMRPIMAGGLMGVADDIRTHSKHVPCVWMDTMEESSAEEQQSCQQQCKYNQTRGQFDRHIPQFFFHAQGDR